MKVPLLDLKEQYESLRDALLPEVLRLFESQQFILGSPVETLEAEIASYCGVGYAVGVASGSDALLLALMAGGIGPGDEVITTPYTFFSTVSAIVRAGARTVLVDIDPDSYNIDPAGIEERITERTRGVLPVHLFGRCADMHAMVALARKHELFVVEDAAQAIGAEYKGRRAGALGDVGCLSFFPSKNLGGFGDGGMIVTNRGELAERIRILRVHGMQPKYVHRYVGINSRLDALQAVVLTQKLKHLDDWHRRRRENAEHYNRCFREAGLTEKGAVVLPPGDGTAASPSGEQRRDVFNQYVIRVRDRDGLREYLAEQGVGSEVYYPIPLHLQECFASLGYRRGNFPESERAAQETLALPIYPELTRAQQDFVVDRIAAYY